MLGQRALVVLIKKAMEKPKTDGKSNKIDEKSDDPKTQISAETQREKAMNNPIEISMEKIFKKLKKISFNKSKTCYHFVKGNPWIIDVFIDSYLS